MSASRRFLHQRIDEEEVWVDLEGGCFFGLNETGTAILEAYRAGLQEPRSIAEHLVSTYDAEPEELEVDVAAFLAEARTRGLLDA